jgi:hypothetical protein
VGVPPTKPPLGGRDAHPRVPRAPHASLEIFSKFRYALSKFRYFPISAIRPPRLCTRDIFMRCLARSRSVDSQISQSAPPAELPLAVYDLHRPRCCALRANLRLVYLQLSRACDSRPSQGLGSPFGLPSAGLVRIPPGMSHPSGYSCSLPRKPPLAWFPASARWHVFGDPTLVFHSRGFASFAGAFGFPRFPLHSRGLPWLQRIFSVAPCLRESPAHRPRNFFKIPPRPFKIPLLSDFRHPLLRRNFASLLGLLAAAWQR